MWTSVKVKSKKYFYFTDFFAKIYSLLTHVRKTPPLRSHYYTITQGIILVCYALNALKVCRAGGRQQRNSIRQSLCSRYSLANHKVKYIKKCDICDALPNDDYNIKHEWKGSHSQQINSKYWSYVSKYLFIENESKVYQ